MVSTKFKMNLPTTNPEPINEYQHDGICSLLFPLLFPTGFGDATKNSRLIAVSKTLGYKNLLTVNIKNTKN